MRERVSEIPKAIEQEAPQSSEIDPTDVKAVREMVWSKLVAIAATMPPNGQALPILREIMDRLEGKPAQTVAMTVKDESLDKVSTEKLLRLASMLDEPLVIAPMPQKLVD